MKVKCKDLAEKLGIDGQVALAVLGECGENYFLLGLLSRFKLRDVT